jgi:CubicO group peptidase (beta-lactamase class C family)
LTSTGAALADYSGAPLYDIAMPPKIKTIPDIYNRLDMRRACSPSAGGIATARGVARFFAILANGGVLDGKRLLSEERVRSFLEVRPNTTRMDEVAGQPTTLGIGGFWVQNPSGPDQPLIGSGANILYHTGAGNTMAFADLDRRMAVAICHNRMFGAIEKHPFVGLADAVRDVVDDRAMV